MAMGLAAPAEAGVRRDDATASAGSLDTALVAASARRARPRTTADLDGQPTGHGPFGLFHALWLTTTSSFHPPQAVPASGLAPAVSRAPTAPLLAPRTSRGPPPRS